MRWSSAFGIRAAARSPFLHHQAAPRHRAEEVHPLRGRHERRRDARPLRLVEGALCPQQAFDGGLREALEHPQGQPRYLIGRGHPHEPTGEIHDHGLRHGTRQEQSRCAVRVPRSELDGGGTAPGDAVRHDPVDAERVEQRGHRVRLLGERPSGRERPAQVARTRDFQAADAGVGERVVASLVVATRRAVQEQDGGGGARHQVFHGPPGGRGDLRWGRLTHRPLSRWTCNSGGNTPGASSVTKCPTPGTSTNS